ncbi:hypothetical protein MLGJGCBP_04262 [Rhodococcus sp. T7]|uniref:Uncharacterized protein n=1 Tax=Rhodococcus wratislaviensis TaxID=44752 RepID=A0A402BZD8_RHOWR|nr:hypothetical protein MLGJGCBP_04262 [Rhodococcus sp. T7]GCE36709.1 hypothetical protein Rhow_003313 [Rhodococcus wratislaviensis]
MYLLTHFLTHLWVVRYEFPSVRIMLVGFMYRFLHSWG